MTKSREYCPLVMGTIINPVLMRIPFEKEIAMIYSQGTAIVDILTQYREKFKELFEGIRSGKFS